MYTILQNIIPISNNTHMPILSQALSYQQWINLATSTSSCQHKCTVMSHIPTVLCIEYRVKQLSSSYYHGPTTTDPPLSSYPSTQTPPANHTQPLHSLRKRSSVYTAVMYETNNYMYRRKCAQHLTIPYQSCSSLVHVVPSYHTIIMYLIITVWRYLWLSWQLTVYKAQWGRKCWIANMDKHIQINDLSWKNWPEVDKNDCFLVPQPLWGYLHTCMEGEGRQMGTGLDRPFNGENTEWEW